MVSMYLTSTSKQKTQTPTSEEKNKNSSVQALDSNSGLKTKQTAMSFLVLTIFEKKIDE